MALSGSYDFTLQRNQIIKRALLLLGVIASNETPDADEYSDASEALNLMLKSWQNDGLQLWRKSTFNVTPVQGQQFYTLGSGTYTPRPIDVLEVYRRETSTNIDVQLNQYSRVDFNNLSDKDSEGTPVNFYYDPQMTASKLYVWPTASSDFATNYTLQVLYTKPFDDMDSSDDNLAFPQEWELAVVYGLALVLAFEYGTPNAELRLLREEATRYKNEAMYWDTEHDAIFITPDPQSTHYV
jgi:hypothetical protein